MGEQYDIKGKGRLDMSKISQEQIIKMINLQRHDLLNHIQVLHGFLKLGSYDEMMHYLEKITTQLQNEHYISQLRSSELFLYIHTYPVRNAVMLFEVEIAETIHLDEYNIVNEQIKLLIELLELVSQGSTISNDVLPSLLLTMGKLGDRVKFTIDYVGYLNQEVLTQEWSRIYHQLLELGTTINEKEQSENEWLLEIIMG